MERDTERHGEGMRYWPPDTGAHARDEDGNIIASPRTGAEGTVKASAIDPDEAAALVASERWKSKVMPDSETGCLMWMGATNGNGYGRLSLAGRSVGAHRVAFVASTAADIPAGLVVDHVCRNRACVNPLHLRAVAQSINNTENSLGASALNARKSRCPAGHPLEGENLAPSVAARGWRACLTCIRSHSRDDSAAIKRAREALGLPYREYVGRYGASRATAERMILLAEMPNHAGATGSDHQCKEKNR